MCMECVRVLEIGRTCKMKDNMLNNGPKEVCRSLGDSFFCTGIASPRQSTDLPQNVNCKMEEEIGVPFFGLLAQCGSKLVPRDLCSDT